MSYTPPNSDEITFDVSSYSPPSSDSVDFTIGTTDSKSLSRSVSISGDGAISTTASAVGQISAPTNLQTDTHPDGVIIQWDNTDNVSSGGYVLHRFEDDEAFAFSGDTTGGGFNDGGWSDGSFITRSINYNDTSYIDTNPSENPVEYRLYRYANDNTVTSDVVAYVPAKSLSRSVTLQSQPGQLQATRGTLTKSRTVESEFPTGTLDTQFDLLDVFPDPAALEVEWNYTFQDEGFVLSEWFYEDSEIPRQQRGGFGVTLYGRLSNEINVWIKKRLDDEIITAEKQPVSQQQQTIVFDAQSEFYENGEYRVLVQGLRSDDVVNQVDFGHVHENL